MVEANLVVEEALGNILKFDTWEGGEVELDRADRLLY